MYVVDTHAVSNELKGDCKNGVIFQCLHTVTVVAAVSSWLFARLFGTSAQVEHEMAIMIARPAVDSDENTASQELFSQSSTTGDVSASVADSAFIEPLPIPATVSMSVDNTLATTYIVE